MAKKKTDSKAKEATKKVAPKKVDVKLDPLKKYEIEGLGKDGLAKGKIFQVTGEIASILIKKGSAILKK